MITLKLEEVLTKKGKTAYEVAKNTRLHQSVISKIRRNEAKMIGLDVLNTLCEELDCEPSDLISFTSSKPTAKTPVAVSESVKGDSVKKATKKPVESLDNEHILTVKDVGKMLDRSPRQVRTYAERRELKGKQGKQSHWFFRQTDVDDYLKSRS